MTNKPFKPSDHQRETVEIAVHLNTPENAIARSLKIDEKTLRRHFSDELKFGSERCEAKVYASIYRGALAGNASAQRLLVKRFGSLADASKSISQHNREGKKKIASNAAVKAAAGTSWEFVMERPTLEPKAARCLKNKRN